MKNQHTPGPWTIEQGGLSGATIVGTFCLERVPVCGKIANAADANLIAEAPDLLRQRDELLSALENLLSPDEPTAKDWATACAAVDSVTRSNHGGE